MENVLKHKMVWSTLLTEKLQIEQLFVFVHPLYIIEQLISSKFFKHCIGSSHYLFQKFSLISRRYDKRFITNSIYLNHLTYLYKFQIFNIFEGNDARIKNISNLFTKVYFYVHSLC